MFTLHHATLMAAHRPTGDVEEIFDAHVLACVLASALETASVGEGTVSSETGLDAATLGTVIGHWFPRAERAGFGLDAQDAPALEMEEEMLRDLLLAHGAATDRSGASPSRDAEPPLPVPPPPGGRGRRGMGLSEFERGADLRTGGYAEAAVASGRVDVAMADAPASSPPLWGRDRERGMDLSTSEASTTGAAATPLPVPPPQGGRGREGMGLSHHGSGAELSADASRASAAATDREIGLAKAASTASSPPSRGRDREGGLGASECHIGCEEPHLPTLLAAVIARRAMKPDHLWQDLGLFDRSELNRLLARHFPTLHAGNTANMRWKKYFYRKLCEAEGFSLCTAPSCALCADFASCFGAEDGESRMAQARLAVDRAAAE